MFTPDRRDFLKTTLLGAGALAASALPSFSLEKSPAYRGPNVILIRFGGGARRRESIDPEHTFAPFVCKEFAQRGTLFSKMEIAQIKDLNTSHGEGTLNLVTGKYDKYKDIENGFLRGRFEAKVPTVFEYLRKTFDVPEHQTLMINSEDRADEEFYTFSNHVHFGVDCRANMLSLYRFKSWLFHQQIAEGKLSGKEMAERRKTLAKWEKHDPRLKDAWQQSAQLDEFWERWRAYYGDSGFVNPRGDRLLTELTIRALKELRPRLTMVNYTDCDYVHWGNQSFYTNGVRIMDEGIRQIVGAVEADEFYRGNTIFAIVPDCGRDDNPFVSVPFQHHFNSRSAHEIFALFVGPGIPRGVVDKKVDQCCVAATIGRAMGFKTEFAEGQVLAEAFA